MQRGVIGCTVLVALALASISNGAELPRLKVSENKRFLMTEKGEPFFWLGDTAWELFHRCDRAEAERYLAKRAGQGFNVVQAVAIAEVDGHSVPNANGHLPLVDWDPARPAVKEGPDNDYWDHVDFVVDRANAAGLYVGFLPTWGRYWHDKVKDGKPIFSVDNAYKYGEWLGRRYKDKGLVWILGGDRSVDNDEQREIIRAMARGLKAGDGGRHLMTFHPSGGQGSAMWFHDDDWLDFNMRQNGHGAEFSGPYSQTRVDYDRKPTKPILDGEPVYEDHPLSFDAKRLGHSIAADCRRTLYWDLFNGACGHTYGHHSVWQIWQPGRAPINGPLLPWIEALDQPGAKQMMFGKRLMESRPYLTRVPDDSLVVPAEVPTSVPGSGRYRFAATRDAGGSYAMVYVPTGRPFRARTDKLTGAKLKTWWFDPRTGAVQDAGVVERRGELSFVSPDRGDGLDWVLVIDDASKAYAAPGQVK